MFYQRYIDLCNAKGESPSSAAEKAGFNKGTVSVWKKKFEQGIDVDPDQSVINKICSYFNVSESSIRGFGALDAVLPPNMKGVNLTGAKIDSQFLNYMLLNLSCLGTESGKYESTKNEILNIAKSSGLEKMAAEYIEKLESSKNEQQEKPTPVSESGQPVNIVRIAGRDGRYMEKRLTDEQIKALQTIIDQMPEADDL